MDSLFKRAAEYGIETEHWDGLGRHWKVEPLVLEKILAAIASKDEPQVAPDTRAVTPGNAYQGSDTLPRRSWVIVVQLYGVRSGRNWGHGDFTDLANLIDIASSLGAAGIGLNPLHALFDDQADEASPYFPNSRQFLNPLYIDVEAIPELPPSALTGLQPEIDAARQQEFVSYPGVAKTKAHALAVTYDNFCKQASDTRRRQFDEFRRGRGTLLASFAAFELLRRRFRMPWWEWPREWRRPGANTLEQLRKSETHQVEYFEFVQWIAHQQLAACRDRANGLGLPIGLYLDLAVGVRPDGFDAWDDQDFILPNVEMGAPADRLNTQGQRWGLAGFNPGILISRNCEPFRKVLQASMQYAGTIRLDHVLGLKRYYFIPKGLRPDQGAYVRFPFEALLMAAVQESIANNCIVIGEDLGTVPPAFRETLAKWGIWSYQVMLFERAADGGYIAPDLYRENALVTFATHDLPTFAGWASGHDLAVMHGLGLDPGVSDGERIAAREAMGRAMAWQGLPAVDYLSILKFLADTPSRLLAVTMEDALGLVDQVNVPGTIAEHPNWRRRLPVGLEDLLERSSLSAIAELMAATGRRARI
jgi:4-alpha-glucanotransferase